MFAGRVSQDVAPSKEIFDRVPEEVLAQGWLATLEYVRQLEGQGEVACYEVRVLLMGSGEAGKTSLVRALRSGGVTGRIEKDDRTVGIEIEKMDLGAVVKGVVCDMAGQAAYDVVHAAFTGNRCVVLVVFRPDEEGVRERVERTLQRLHAQSPGAHVMLVCTRWESPGEGRSMEEHWEEARERVAEVEEGAGAMVQRLNGETADKAERLHLRRDALLAQADAALLHLRLHHTDNQLHQALQKLGGDDGAREEAEGVLKALKEVRAIEMTRGNWGEALPALMYGSVVQQALAAMEEKGGERADVADRKSVV